MQATAGVPAETNGLADFYKLRRGPHFCDFADGFMAWDEWKLGHMPFVGPHGHIGMADAAILDFYFNLLSA
jgi:hypothetical protein